MHLSFFFEPLDIDSIAKNIMQTTVCDYCLAIDEHSTLVVLHGNYQVNHGYDDIDLSKNLNSTLLVISITLEPQQSDLQELSSPQPHFLPLQIPHQQPILLPPHTELPLLCLPLSQLPTSYTAYTTPSQIFARTPTPVFVPYLTLSQQLFSCSSFPFSDFSNRSPTSPATFLPNLNKFPTCSDVNSRTFRVVFLASFKFSLVESFTSVSSLRLTLLAIKPPKLSIPRENSPPVYFSPLLNCFEAPTSTPCSYFSFSSFISSSCLSSTTSLFFETIFSSFSPLLNSLCFSLFLSTKCVFQLRHENNQSVCWLTFTIHFP